MQMVHGFVNLVYDEQGGPRGATKTFSSSMLMLMARRELTDGAFGARLMLSADPLMGKSGYPLLFQTGESADGHTPLIDRQHPHDLLMEAALTYSHELNREGAVFVYAGLPGEPALGPPTFMHRLSGMDNPEAPLGHHWLDSTHISWGVVSAGYTWKQLRLEASGFNGREPDENRYNIELRSLDSYAARLSYNPTANLSMQASFGRLASPEQLEPDVSVRRSTASVSYNAPAVRVVANHLRLRTQQSLQRRGQQCVDARVGAQAGARPYAVRPPRTRRQGRTVPARGTAVRAQLHDREALGGLHLRFPALGRARSRAWRSHQQLQLSGDAERDIVL